MLVAERLISCAGFMYQRLGCGHLVRALPHCQFDESFWIFWIFWKDSGFTGFALPHCQFDERFWIFWIFDFLRYLQKYSVFCLLVFTTGLLSLRPSRGYPYCILSPPAASDEFLPLRIPTPETPRRASTAAPSPPTAPQTLYINILDTMG